MNKILVTYFSATGVTANAAKMFAKAMDADLDWTIKRAAARSK